MKELTELRVVRRSNLDRPQLEDFLHDQGTFPPAAQPEGPRRAFELDGRELPQGLVPLWQLVDHFAYRRSLEGVGERPVSLYQNIEYWEPAPQSGAEGQ